MKITIYGWSTRRLMKVSGPGPTVSEVGPDSCDGPRGDGRAGRVGVRALGDPEHLRRLAVRSNPPRLQRVHHPQPQIFLRSGRQTPPVPALDHTGSTSR